MYQKVIAIRGLEALLSKERYLSEPNHPRHVDQIIGSRYLCGRFTEGLPADFIAHSRAEEIARRNRDIRRGPKIEVIAYEGILRNAPVTQLEMAITDEEVFGLISHIHQSMGFDMFAQSHHHPTADVDIHVVLVDEFPRKPSIGLLFRQAVQGAFSKLNAERRRQGRIELPGIEDSRSAKLLARGFSPLAIQLALQGAGDLSAIPQALANLNHQLGTGGIDAEANKIHVVHHGRPDLTYAYNLRRLLDEVEKALEELADGPETVSVESLAEQVTPEQDLDVA